ncbi:MAG: YceI family protein [Putridiphycobacter sp.]
MKRNVIIGSLMALFLISCNTTDTNDQSNEQAVEEHVEVCTYAYNPESTVVGWTAFKFTEKTGVSGKFDDVQVAIANQESEDMFAVLNGASVTIPVNSVNSENPERDQKIDSLFFGAMEATDMISALVKDINAEKAVIEISMNNVSKEYEGTISVENETVKFNTTINLDDFEAQSAVTSLNDACKDLHTGEDGVSKLWSEVDINVETTLTKTCK